MMGISSKVLSVRTIVNSGRFGLGSSSIVNVEFCSDLNEKASASNYLRLCLSNVIYRVSLTLDVGLLHIVISKNENKDRMEHLECLMKAEVPASEG